MGVSLQHIYVKKKNFTKTTSYGFGFVGCLCVLARD